MYKCSSVSQPYNFAASCSVSIAVAIMRIPLSNSGTETRTHATVIIALRKLILASYWTRVICINLVHIHLDGLLPAIFLVLTRCQHILVAKLGKYGLFFQILLGLVLVEHLYLDVFPPYLW